MFKTILIALKEARQIRNYIEIADRAEFWTKWDGAWLVRQMVSSSGKKLKARLNAMVFKSALRACSVETNGDYERGIARGILLAVQAFDQHMDVARQPEETDFSESHTVNSDISGLADRLAS